MFKGTPATTTTGLPILHRRCSRQIRLICWSIASVEGRRSTSSARTPQYNAIRRTTSGLGVSAMILNGGLNTEIKHAVWRLTVYATLTRIFRGEAAVTAAAATEVEISRDCSKGRGG